MGGEGSMRDAKSWQRAQRDFYVRDDVQACICCGRYFTRRKDNVCSMSCAAKLKEKELEND